MTELDLVDVPDESGDDRYAIYAILASDVARRSLYGADINRRRIAETSRDGIGLTLVTLREDGEIDGDTRVGIFDRLDRVWIVNPWAKGTL